MTENPTTDATAVRCADGLERRGAKRCIGCGGMKDTSEFYHAGKDPRCKGCANEQAHRWAIAHPAKIAESRARYNATEKGRVAARKNHALYRTRHPGKVKSQKAKAYWKKRPHYLAKAAAWAKKSGYLHQKRAMRKAIAELGRRYVIPKIVRGTKLRWADVPDSLIELYRSNLALKRLCQSQRISTNSATNS